MTAATAYAAASQAQAALSDAIRSGDADAIILASTRFSSLIDAAGISTQVTDIRPATILRADIVTTHQTLNLLHDAAVRRAARLAELQGRPPVSTYQRRASA